MMEKSITSLKNYIQETLESSMKEPQIEEIEFNELIKIMLIAFENVAYQHKVRLTMNVSPFSIYWGYKTDVHSILLNLISNAIKYRDPSKKESTILVNITCTHEGARILVEDNGLGISEKDLERIYDTYFQVQRTKQGIGMGLQIVKDSVIKSKGTISVDSQLGERTSFEVFLPNLNIEGES